MMLRQEREKRNLKVSDVAHQLNVRPAYVKAMEEGRFSDLPGSIYSFGYLKIYARMLNLSTKELLADLKESSRELMKNDILTLQGDPYNQEIRPSNFTITMSVILTLIVYVFWYGQRYLLDSRNAMEFKKAREEMVIDAVERIRREAD